MTPSDRLFLTPQELLEQLTFAEECGKLIMPPCWKTGDHCTGKLVHSYNPADPAQPTTLLSRAHDRGLKVYPYTFRNEVRLRKRRLGVR